ncbi:hypothetical protein FB562_2200 [Homoserinimonas aerilata]|uniref:Uncharacterized protein n=1 Tax=Homoserinimonas aerilata TaxID=1162970 RepID=A0A542YF05_9MICO|nr:Rho termination factor N-terminal domain-containing protein [Homoserinimonas aerilata]TQL46676.1 hypothetical protein FB562_2200 [Homoserinimonas aerilata]
MIRITHPRPQAGRQKDLGIEFRDGVAEVTELHPVREQALVQHGYAVEVIEPELIDLEALTVRELRDIADTEGIDLPKGVKKAEMVDLISRAPVAEAIAIELPTVAGWYADPEGAVFYLAEDGSWMSPDSYGADPQTVAGHRPLIATDTPSGD